MGCWNETCAVSKLTIDSGEAVRFLPIIQNAWHYKKQVGFPNGEAPTLFDGASGVYNFDLWMPFCLPIRGTYNDYGTIEDVPEKTEVDKAELAQFIAAFEKHAVKLGMGENPCHDVALTEFTLESILGALHEGRVYVNFSDYVTATLTVSWVMIKESVWQSLLELDIFDSDRGSFAKYRIERGEADTISLDGIRFAITSAIKRDTELTSLDSKLEAIINGSGEVEGARELANAVIKLSGGLGSLARFRLAAFENGPHEFYPPMLPTLTETLTEFQYVSLILASLRINLSPTCGSGSQSRNQYFWQLVYKKWEKIASGDAHKYDDEREEDDEE